MAVEVTVPETKHDDRHQVGIQWFSFARQENKGINVMRCPFCNEDVRDDASVCRYCGNDLKIPEFLTAENAELKERVAMLEGELAELHHKLAFQKSR